MVQCQIQSEGKGGLVATTATILPLDRQVYLAQQVAFYLLIYLFEGGCLLLFVNM